MRASGGLLYLSGALIMVYNLWKTIKGELRTEAEFEEPAHVAVGAAE